MLHNLREGGWFQRFTAEGPTPRWARSIGLTAAVGIAYFLAARLSLFLVTEPDGVAVFWPAAGIAAGVLIALGPGARWPVATGAMAATIMAHLWAEGRINWGDIVFALCNAGEAVLVAALIERYFGSQFGLDRLRYVLGLLAAAIVGTAVSGIGGTAGFLLFQSSTAPILTTWQHWFASDALGIVTVAPLLIGLAAAARDPPPAGEVVEGTVALATLAVVSGLVIFLPPGPWGTVVPIALLFPLLLWLAARCGPVCSAVAAFIIALTIVWTTIFEIGHFGDPSLPVDDRILSGQAIILTASLCAYVLAALFAERSQSEGRLIRSNWALQRERENKLMSLEAMVASISHEVRQPLTAIANNGNAARLYLQHVPPNLEKAQSALDAVVIGSYRANEVFDNIRALFASADQGRKPIEVNEMVLGVLRDLRGELDVHGITTRTALASELPRVIGHSGQLQAVILNLIRNAIEAMQAPREGSRVLRVKTEYHGREAITVTVEDSGPGINPGTLEGIFDAFVTTKTQGMGLGLAICRMIVERHGGRLTASSDGKCGALFQFVLPIEITEKAAAPAK
jgi:signal transduction histidine kinase